MLIKKLSLILTVFVFVILYTANAAWEIPETGTVGPVGAIVSQGNYVFAGSSSTAVSISANNGDQWLERNEGLNSTDVQSMAVIGNSIFAATNGQGVYASNNSGESWAEKNSGLGNYSVYSLYANNNNLYAVTDESGVFMTSDNGNNWISLNNGDIIGIICYTVTSSNGIVYVGAQYGNLYTTSDNGSTWNNLKAGPLAFNIKSIDIKNDKILVGTTSGVFISDNAGLDWRVLNNGLKNTDVTQVRFVTNNSKEYIYAATKGGGLYISENYGVSWFAMNDELPDMNLLSFGFHNNYIFAGSQFSTVARRKMSEMIVPEVKAPILESPVNMSENIAPSVTFIWKESIGAKSYHLQISLSEDFSNPIVERDNLTTITVNQNLEKGLKYYWRVAANTDKNEKLWSEVWIFTTRLEQTKPILVSPTDMESNVPLKSIFTWNATDGTSSYVLQIAKDKEFTELVTSQVNIKDTTATFDGLEENTVYYWLVGSIGYDDAKILSEPRVFSTGEYASVYHFVNGGADSQAQIFPNPVNEQLTLLLNQTSKYVRISLVPLNGENMMELYSGPIIGGAELKFDKQVVSLPSGLYLIRVDSEESPIIVPFIKQ